MQGAAVTVRLRIQRWQCRNKACKRKTFAGQLPDIAVPLARRTARVAELVHLFGHGGGGRPGERLMKRIGMPTSDDTILRHLKRWAKTHSIKSPVRVAGIDDWAWRKGAHEGAPQARQIADRFHILQSLREAIQAQFSRVAGSSARPLLPADVDDECEAMILSRPRDKRGGAEHRCLTRMANQRSRQSIFDQVRALHREGKSVSYIVRQMGFDRRTIAKWIRTDVLPQRNAAAPKTTSPRYFEEYLSRRWSEGCVRGRRLFQQIKARGYTGSLSNLERLLVKLRNPKRKVARPALVQTA
jgi:hypothetical protein